jgi:hypothetical protein
MTMHVGWPQGIAIGLMVLNLIFGAVLDGNPKTGTHKFSVSFCGVILNAALLYWGGFFA